MLNTLDIRVIPQLKKNPEVTLGAGTRVSFDQPGDGTRETPMGSPFETSIKTEAGFSAERDLQETHPPSTPVTMLTRLGEGSGRIEAVDEALAKWLNSETEDLVGQDWSALIANSCDSRELETFTNPSSSRFTGQGEAVFRSQNGDQWVCSVQSRVLKQGNQSLLLWTILTNSPAAQDTADNATSDNNAVFSLLDYMVGYLVNRTHAATGVLLWDQSGQWQAHTIYPDTEDVVPLPTANSQLLSDVIKGKVLVVEKGAQTCYPGNSLSKFLNAEAFVGLALSKDTSTLAVLLLFFNDPITNGKSMASLLGRHREALTMEVQRIASRSGLPEREARFRDMFDNAYDLVQSVAPNGRFLYTNRIWHEKLEYSEEETASLNVLDVIHTAYRETYEDCLARLQKGSESEHIEFMMVSKSGQVFVVEGDISVRAHRGQALATRGIYRDITRRRKSEEELRLARELANATIHNIGNVLNSVNASCHAISETVRTSSVQLLDKVNRLFERHQEDLPQFLSRDGRGKLLPQFIQQVTSALHDENAKVRNEMNDLRRLLSLIKDIAFSQQALAKENPAIYEEIGLQDLLEEAMTIQVPNKLHASINIERDFQSTGMVTGPRGAIVHVVMNILKNARQALEGNPRDNRLIIVSIFEEDEWTILRIQDNGPGITEEHIQRIFDYGFTTKPEGHGFGLHYCAKVMRDLGGSLIASSEGPGKGSTFDLRFLGNHEIAIQNMASA